MSQVRALPVRQLRSTLGEGAHKETPYSTGVGGFLLSALLTACVGVIPAGHTIVLDNLCATVGTLCRLANSAAYGASAVNLLQLLSDTLVRHVKSMTRHARYVKSKRAKTFGTFRLLSERRKLIRHLHPSREQMSDQRAACDYLRLTLRPRSSGR